MAILMLFPLDLLEIDHDMTVPAARFLSKHQAIHEADWVLSCPTFSDLGKLIVYRDGRRSPPRFDFVRESQWKDGLHRVRQVGIVEATT